MFNNVKFIQGKWCAETAMTFLSSDGENFQCKPSIVQSLRHSRKFTESFPLYYHTWLLWIVNIHMNSFFMQIILHVPLVIGHFGPTQLWGPYTIDRIALLSISLQNNFNSLSWLTTFISNFRNNEAIWIQGLNLRNPTWVIGWPNQNLDKSFKLLRD